MWTRKSLADNDNTCMHRCRQTLINFQKLDNVRNHCREFHKHHCTELQIILTCTVREKPAETEIAHDIMLFVGSSLNAISGIENITGSV